MTSLLNLNSDCLLEIFQYLTIIDLIQISSVVGIDSDVLRTSFAAKFAEEDFKLTALLNKETLKSFINCAPKIQKITLDFKTIKCDKYKMLILELVARLCKNLKSLTLIGYIPIANDIKNLNICGQNIKKLTIVDSNIRDNFVEQILSENKSLNHIVIENCIGLNGDFLAKLHNLETAIFEGVRIEGLHGDEFVKNNPNIKELELAYTDSPEFMEAVCSLTCLKKIKLIMHWQSLNNCLKLARLPTLREVTVLMNCDRDRGVKSLQFLEELGNTNSLEYLDVCFQNKLPLLDMGKFTNLKTLYLNEREFNRLTDIYKLKSLEVLSLNEASCITRKVILQLIRELPNLRVLHVEFCPFLERGSEVAINALLKSLGRTLELHVFGSELWLINDAVRANLSAITFICSQGNYGYQSLSWF